MRFIKPLTLLFFSIQVLAQTPVFHDLEKQNSNGSVSEYIDLFDNSIEKFPSIDLPKDTLEKGMIYKLDNRSVRSIKEFRPEQISTSIRLNPSVFFELELYRFDILSEDFNVFVSSNPEISIPYDKGIHYRGVIKNDPNSLVVFSIFNELIMGLISSNGKNYILSPIENNRDQLHWFYAEEDFEVGTGKSCDMPDDQEVYNSAQLVKHSNKNLEDCVRVYVEINDDIVNAKGNPVNATNYIEGLFAQSFTLYYNEGLIVQLSEVLAWDSTSPYNSSSSLGMLNAFQENTGEFNGDLAHLVSYKASGGIAASFNGICNNNTDLSKCFSSIDPSYKNVPSFSWSVMVITHEMGHLLGARHTHACVWNGNGTAIDGCAQSTEGSCDLPNFPEEGGTIMSYCHLQDVGINFNEGFGEQPSAVINNTILFADCLFSCEPTTCNNGILDGSEEGIDCGGPDCPECPTCEDGIQNGNEQGIDCGGSECEPCPQIYCSSSGISQSYEYIESVQVDTFQNVSGKNFGYGDFLNYKIILEADSAYTFELTPGFPGNSYDEYWCVWIDLNKDFDFEDEGELIYKSNAKTLLGFDWKVPELEMNLSTRIRISMQYHEYPLPCENFTYGEVEDYSIILITEGGENCEDDLMNGEEEGIDCGGPDCEPCSLCGDGLQNGDEEGVDCGGLECPICPTCEDGVLNGDEEGIDCGGEHCPVCPSCADGIQNGMETGIDCGGPVCVPCSTEGCTYQKIDFNDFEEGWGIWADGGSDCRRDAFDANWAYSGTYPVRLRDDSETSHLTTKAFNLVNYNEASLSFTFITRSVDDNTEYFVLERSDDNGVSFSIVKSWVYGTDFENDSRYFESLKMNGPFTSYTKFRLRSIFSTNSDWVYFDDIEIKGCLYGIGLKETLVEHNFGERIESKASVSGFDWTLYPNPVANQLTIEINSDEKVTSFINILNIRGEQIYRKTTLLNIGTNMIELNVMDLHSGIYIIQIISPKGKIIDRFIKE